MILSRFHVHVIQVLLILSLAVATACSPEGNKFRKVPSSESGITFTNTITEDESNNVLDYEYMYNGGGVAVADFNNDGMQDLYFTGNMVSNKLYLNDGELRFKDLTQLSG